ncbi:MAG: class I SAM-dependent methyltransferase [Bacilli bacterium]|nr:class I SAM-dependent methyltransferase [Bacilli bacterium]
MISNRLKSLAKYFDKDDKVIDIGCDHALLDIYLIEEGILKNMIVSDIHEKALQQGIDNIKLHKLEKRIETRLGNGLEVLNENDDIDTVLISGMGTSTIIDILDGSIFPLGPTKKLKKLVIQSNNDHDILRHEIAKEAGFEITNEEFFIDNKKAYINIVFEKNKKFKLINYNKKDIKYGPFLKSNIDYLNYREEYVKKILDKVPKNKIIIRYILNKELKDINRFKKNIK